MTKNITVNSQPPNQEASDADLKELKSVASKGAFWTLANYGLSQALRFGSNLILTHMLFPELFGLMSLVNVIIMGLALFSDIGIGISIVQSKRGNDQDFLNSAWTIQVIRGFWIWIVAAAIAYPASQFYNTPELIWLIPIIAVNSVISGFNSTGLFTSYRNMAVKKLVIVGLTTQTIALVIMVTWAWLYPSIWALIAGTIASTLMYTIWSHFFIPLGCNSR
jgi:O-antigen/teichoic acid export membrane protein